MEQIERAYEPSQKEIAVTSKPVKSHRDWAVSKYKSFRDNLKNHYREQQSNLCCYCKKTLGFDLKEVEIEHVLPKSIYTQFIFESRNLALSCPACNTSKGSIDVFVGKQVTSCYPIESDSFSIIHPHYDKYSEHINIVEQFLYAPLSKKGTETIRTCKLHRLNKVMKNANTINKEKVSAETLIEGISAMTKEQRQIVAQMLFPAE